MMVYRLRCSAGHDFDAWFRDSAAYDAQSAAGVVECPLCGDTHVHKAPMAPFLGKSRHARDEDTGRRLLRAIDALREHVESSFEYVGERFAEEARRIHSGQEEERGIYGEATQDEAADLAADGITVLPLPRLPRRDT